VLKGAQRKLAAVRGEVDFWSFWPGDWESALDLLVETIVE